MFCIELLIAGGVSFVSAGQWIAVARQEAGAKMGGVQLFGILRYSAGRFINREWIDKMSYILCIVIPDEMHTIGAPPLEGQGVELL